MPGPRVTADDDGRGIASPGSTNVCAMLMCEMDNPIRERERGEDISRLTFRCPNLATRSSRH